MHLLLDQMFDEDVARALRGFSHDVVRVCDVGMASATDDAILDQAIHQDRILVTLDEHFGDWSILPLSTHPGVIRLKVNPTTSKNILDLLLPFLNKAAGRVFRDRLVIVRSTGVRWIRTESRQKS
jgi:predicted nuclease of predicted toxin-antitoxin system